MIKTYLFTKKDLKEDISIDHWRSVVAADCALLWVDVREAGREELERLASLFGLHAVAIESCLDPFRRPHLYEFADHFYTNLTTVRATRGDHGFKPSELHLFVGEKFIITISREKKAEAVDKAIEEYKATPGMCARGSVHAVYLLAEDLTETYFPLVEKLDEDADKIETTMLDKADRSSVQELFGLKRKVFALRKLLGPQRDIFSELARREFPFLTGENQVYFQDVYGRMVRIFDMLDTVREILSGGLDIYLSTVSNRLNEVMKVLTVASIILMTLSFITGFYGMNFVHLPWLKSPNAFRNICISMVALTGGMFWWFRRKKWL